MFNDPLTVAGQYWCGYLQADGGYNRGSTVFAQSIGHPVMEFARFIGNGSVSFRNRPSNYGPNPMYLTNSTKPTKRLRELGIKSIVREDLYTSKHFWRGLLDGDGSIGLFKNSGNLYPAITFSGNLHDMTKCSEFIHSTTEGRKAPKVGITRSIYRVGVNGARAVDLALLLYKDEYSANLDKALRAEEMFTWTGKFRR